MKTLTSQQMEARKAKAVSFTRDVLDDPERADEIEGESLEDYAERRGIQIVNPNRRKHMAKTIRDYRDENADLKQQIRDLEEENETLQGQVDEIAQIVAPEEEEEEDDDDQD